MPVQTVGILSPGAMGAAVGRALAETGLDVVTSLAGRSERTRALAAEAGIRDVCGLPELVAESDLVLSILVPSEAVEVAREVADEIASSGRAIAYADCNAVSPETAREMERIVERAGGRYIDAGIIGGPPRAGSVPPRFYASGPHEAILGELDGMGITVPLMGGEAGRASGIKMCYASLTKGRAALYTTALVAAERMGLYPDLVRELESSQADMLAAMQSVNGLSSRAFRWIGEMEEIAATFGDVGVTEKLHLGAAETFQMIADSPIGHERPETVDRSRSLRETVGIFAKTID